MMFKDGVQSVHGVLSAPSKYVISASKTGEMSGFVDWRNGVHARGHVILSTSIGKALDFRFLEKGSAMLCLWLPMDVDRVT